VCAFFMFHVKQWGDAVKNEIKYMELALKEALKARKKDEVPVGAVIVYKNKVIAKAHNLKEKKKLCFMHAEIIAIMKASKKIKNWRLNECEMYVTLKPCDLCMATLKEARIKKVIYATESEKSKENITVPIEKINDENTENECRQILQFFFKNKRK